MTVSERKFQASPQALFDVVVDAEHYPKWLVGTKVVHVTDPEWPTPGSSFQHKVGFGPIEIADRTTVRSIDPGKSLDLIVRARPAIEADVHFEFIADGAGSTLRIDERPRGLYKLAGPVIALFVKPRNDRSLHRLAELID